jgi:predicted small secreted protein
MKRIVVFLIIFIVMFGLTACKKEGMSLYEAAGFEIENIESAGCNTSIAQSVLCLGI